MWRHSLGIGRGCRCVLHSTAATSGSIAGSIVVVVIVHLRAVFALQGGRVIWIVEHEQQTASFFVFVLGGSDAKGVLIGHCA
jgi:hypothetical protein